LKSCSKRGKMFWRFGFHRSSRIDEILARESFTLEEVLGENDVLQECKAEKKELMDFLTRDDILKQLLHYVTVDPPTDMDEKVRFKYPSLAAEVLSSAFWGMVDALCTPTNLEQLWSIVNTSGPIHPLIGSFFLKIFTVLAMKKPDETKQHLKNSPHLLDRVFTHLETPAIADVLMRICLLDASNGVQTEFQTWLVDEVHVVDKLIETFSPEKKSSSALLTNVALLIQDIAFSYRKDMSDKDALSPLCAIYARLMTEDIATNLLSNILSPEATSTERGLQVVQDLLSLPPKGEEEPPYHDYEEERHQSDIAPLLRAVAKYVTALHRILETPPVLK